MRENETPRLFNVVRKKIAAVCVWEKQKKGGIAIRWSIITLLVATTCGKRLLSLFFFFAPEQQ